jgi:6-phosphogluconate dehydrogenase
MKDKNIGYIGLGKMGFNMVELMLEKGYSVVATNRSNEPVDLIKETGAVGVYTNEELINSLETHDELGGRIIL